MDKIFGVKLADGDLPFLFEVLFERFGPEVNFEIQPMSEAELEAGTERVDGLSLVRTRFVLVGQTGERYDDIESEVVDRGRK